MTWPLASGLGSLGRTANSGDGRFAVWNVAWVAHALTTDPLRRLRRQHLPSSRAHARLLGGQSRRRRPRHPGLAGDEESVYRAQHGRAVRRSPRRSSSPGCWPAGSTGDGAAAATAAALFAFCPYVFAHTAHIQLLMIAGIPMCMLAFHAPGRRRRRRGEAVLLGRRPGGAGAVVRLLRHLGRPHDRLRDALLCLVAPPVVVAPLLDRDRHCRRRLGCDRAAVLPAVPVDPERDRLRPFARRRPPLVGIRRVRTSPPARTRTSGCCR